MMEISKCIEVRCNRSKIYKIIANISDYPRIFPYVKSVNIIGKREDDIISAKVDCVFDRVPISYFCEVKCFMNEKIIVSSNNGPFRSLLCKWELHDMKDGIVGVDFYMKLDISSFIGSVISKSYFGRYVNMTIVSLLNEVQRDNY